jgi:hypothetical protein
MCSAINGIAELQLSDAQEREYVEALKRLAASEPKGLSSTARIALSEIRDRRS